MINTRSIIAIIPARSMSKGVRNKNIVKIIKTIKIVIKNTITDLFNDNLDIKLIINSHNT